MKKLLGIVVLGLLLSGNATAKDYNVILKCQVKFMNKALDFDKSINYFGKSGQTKYFHIIKKEALYFEVHSNWDVYEKDFINWHEGDSISNRFIKFGFWPGKRDTNSWIQINRETGKMSWVSATEDHKNSHWYEANCDKINYNDLPVKKVKQKF